MTTRSRTSPPLLPTCVSLMVACCAGALVRAADDDGTDWTPQLVRDAQRWVHDPQDKSIAVVPQGLRVAVPPEKKWRIAAANRIRLPERVGTVRVRVAQLGAESQWLMRIYGDLRGDGHQRTVGLFQDETRTGVATVVIDPRLLAKERPALQVQLGLEGSPGGYVVFDSLEFLPAPERPSRAGRSPQPGQRDIECVTLMPNLPQPLKIRDWRATAVAYDRFVFDFDAKGQYLPLIWLDESRVNIDRPAFGLPSYAGDPHRTEGPRHESITCIGAVLGATVAGVDKRRQRHDYVAMCEAYYNSSNGENLVLNGVNCRSGGSFWYEIWPHIVFYALADRHPEAGRMDAIVRATADRWHDACLAMDDGTGRSDFDHTAFNFSTMQPVDNGRWKEPDAAAGIGWIETMAWMKFRDEKYLAAADRCMQFLERRKQNPYYEVLLPYGTLAAARLNAELGRTYDVDKLLNWCFGISDCRGGWGVIATRWHGYDCHGLLGSIDNRGGYAFAMNTFAQAGALVPLVRYDDRYARAISKWMLNLANAARLFYPGELPDGHESSAFWKDDPQGLIAYEGLRYAWQGKGPYATGDPIVMKWGPATDRGLYGSSYVGLLGAIVRPTDDEAILQLDCLATDFYAAGSEGSCAAGSEGRCAAACPTYLYYNPHKAARQIAVDVGAEPRDVYDACTGKFLQRDVRGRTTVTIPPDAALLLVLPPSGGKVTRHGSKTLVNGVVIDYR
ncbi:MAG: hypothetical protein HQ567_31930 [Candidatus Nealsonbacteria bacterium]|nr:hypothetical protein [Candidatus Nealsonbacteria bacterium]